MNFNKKFLAETELISKYGTEKAYIGWVMSIYLDYPDTNELISESLTEGEGDKKIDFIRYDVEKRKLVITQAAYGKGFYKAKANKASDLNTAIAWIFSGDLKKIRDVSNNFTLSLRGIVQEIRDAYDNEELDEVEILYLHNAAESKNVRDELETVAINTQKLLKKSNIRISYKELGAESVERLFKIKTANILVQEQVTIPTNIQYEENGLTWDAGILTITGKWLKSLYEIYQDDLFSANYRGFLGTKRQKINTKIKSTVENNPERFWAYNNGITILTTKFTDDKDNKRVVLEGISIINGAQTTGSIGKSSASEDKLEKVKIPCRIIKSDDKETIERIVEYNNTQNEIKTWDKFSNDPLHRTLKKEFEVLGYDYSMKRGFGSTNTGLGIEQIIQPVASLRGFHKDASNGKNKIFDSDALYKRVFKEPKSKHLLFAFCLMKAIEERRNELKTKTTQAERKELSLLRNLKAKYFFLSVIGDVLEGVIGEEVDKNQVAFANGIASSKVNSINDLINICKPIVSMVTSIASREIDIEFTEVIKDNEQYKDLVKTINNQIAGIKLIPGNNLFSSFLDSIAPKG